MSIHKTGLVLVDNERIVVPKKEREKIICELHKPHTGITFSQARARRDYFWPEINIQIETHVRKCSDCIKRLPSIQKEPIINQNVSNVPMQIVGADLFESHGHKHLVIVDQYSGYLFVRRLNTIALKAVLLGLK